MADRYAFDREAAERIVKATRRVERAPPAGIPPTPRGRWDGPEPRWEWGKLDGALTGGTGNSQDVSIWRLSADDSSWAEETSLTVDAYAPPFMGTGDTLASGTWVRVMKKGGRWWIVGAACGTGLTFGS